MPIGQHTDPHIKTEIISKIRDHGMRVSEAANHYGISTKSIYAWLGWRDSNPRSRDQNPLPYHLATPYYRG